MIFKLSNLPKFFFTYICPTFYGGSAPATPSTTTQNINSIPPELMPYVLGNLQAAKGQLFKTDEGGQITGYQPYKPYSTDPNKYVAGFSALQKQAQQGAGALKMPGQFGTATGMATEAGQGALGVAGGAIGTGANAARAGEGAIGIGARAYGAGDEYNQMATDPGSMAGWMSPYMQNVTDYQTQQANRQYDISGAQQAGGAARAGAFGGSRDAIMAAENARNRNQAITGIQATGAQTAWQDARQAQQFGANLGMQGYQTGIQGIQAGLQGYQTELQGYDTALKGYQTGIQGSQQLGNLGTQQLAAQTDILGTKSKYGAEIQGRNQALIDQRIKNFENQQNQPYRAMDVMSGLVRGTPIAQSSSTQYAANPSYGQQIGSTIGALGSMYGAYKGKANGGIVQTYADGGSVEQGIEAKLRDMSPEQLRAHIPEITSQEELSIAKKILAEETMSQYARGGIVGYAKGDLVEEEEPVTEEEISDWEKLHGIPFDRNNSEVGRVPAKRAPARGIVEALPVMTNKGIIEEPVVSDSAVGVKPVVEDVIEDVAPAKKKGLESISNFEQESAGVGSTSPKSEDYDNPIYNQNKDVLGITEKEVSEAVGRQYPTQEVVPTAYQPAEEAAQPVAQQAPVSDGLAEERETVGKTPLQIMQERQAEMEKAGIRSSDQISAEQRKEIMAEKANAQDESKRQMYLRMAEFFSNWGSTPGLPLVAGLKAMKDTLPSVMSDSKEDHAVMRSINKSLRDLEHATELEKAGKYNEAYAIKEQAAERIRKHDEHVADLGARREELNKTLESHEKTAKIAAGASMYGADERASRAATGDVGARYNASPDIASLRDIREELKGIDAKIEDVSGSKSPEDVAMFKELKATKKELLDEKVRLKNRMDSRGMSDYTSTPNPSPRVNKNLSTMSQEERFAQQSKLGK
jgi:hypothetical protein